jgi:multicomponent Na+:H+ antiporter subunit G
MSDLVITAVVLVLAALGAFLVLVAGLGILRMPDLLTRMHASSKAATLGGALILLAVAVWFGQAGVWVRVVLIVLFLFATAPVASHMIGRAGYRGGVKLSDDTVIDEYRPTVDEDGESVPD